jgi:phosphohistidine phosphatase
MTVSDLATTVKQTVHQYNPEETEMKVLYLLRHAKSSWDDPGIDDRQRPLNKRGHHSAHLMADHLGKTRFRPAVVLCSTALRARQTWEIIAPALGIDPETAYDDRLYDASRFDLMARIAELPITAPSALLVGHNPGLERLALYLADGASQHPLHRNIKEKFPTGALATLSAPVDDWTQLGEGRWRLEAFVRPADLDATAE